MTVWGVMLGTMISMFDFINHLPYSDSFLGGKTLRNLILHIVTAIICYVLCLIRDTKYYHLVGFIFRKLFFVSWFGIFTLVLSYLVVIMWISSHFVIFSYGLCTINIRFDSSLLFSKDITSFFANIGTAPYTLGYNFCYLTYYVLLRRMH